VPEIPTEHTKISRNWKIYETLEKLLKIMDML